MKVQNPHDRFFKKTFGKAEVAKDFLQNYLPQNILEIIEVDTLEPQKDSHIDEELRESFSDLIFKVKINKHVGYLYLLFEHKSTPSQDAAFQLLKYIVRVWEAKIEETGLLPVVIPLLIYHGKDNWNIEPTLENMIMGYEDLPQDIQLLIPNYKYLLYDFSSFDDEEIKGQIINRIVITILRDMPRSTAAEILKVFLTLVFLLRQLEDKQMGINFFRLMLLYLFSAKPDLTKNDYNKLVKKIETTYPEGSELVMTLAEIFRKEGLEEGLEKGLEKGMEKGMEKGIEKGETQALVRTAIRLLTRRFGPVPDNIGQGIAKLDASKLDLILDRVMDYENLNEVRRDL